MNWREFDKSDADFKALVHLENLTWPDTPVTLEDMQHGDRTRPKDVPWLQWVVENDGQLIGFGSLGKAFWSKRTGRFHLYITINPEWRNQGYGSRMYDLLIEKMSGTEKIHNITSGTRENYKDSLRFLTKRGFVQEIREPVSELDLESFDESPFVHKLERLGEHGLTVASMKELAETHSDWQERYWNLDYKVGQDVPSPEPFKKRSLEEFIKSKIEGPDFELDTRWIALDGDDWVGISELWKSGAREDMAYQGITGVTRAHRRKGVATALKLVGIRYARQRGWRTIITDNEENNPMFGINLALGFKAKPAWLGLRKTLIPDEGETSQ